ncbi:hypothetical protein SO802_023832, partial [Lithocarpus litseifolius]
MEEFHDVHKKVPRVVDHSEDICWKPPDYGLYKINFDGALFADQASAGLAVVIRDSATSRAISFAKELNIHQMVVEGDSLQ